MKRALPVATAIAVLALAAGCGDDAVPLSERQREVAEKGAEVMPFELDATTHRFEKDADGLVQTVVADDPADETQVALVRQHLEEEAGRFAEGDFSDPRTIHGDEMPGVRELSRGAEQLDVDYRPIPGGAQITFRTTSQALVDALHAWASAQLEDHGSHAEHG